MTNSKYYSYYIRIFVIFSCTKVLVALTKKVYFFFPRGQDKFNITLHNIETGDSLNDIATKLKKHRNFFPEIGDKDKLSIYFAYHDADNQDLSAWSEWRYDKEHKVIFDPIYGQYIDNNTLVTYSHH